MQGQVKAFNPQIFLEFLCYSVFGGLIFFLVSSGKYLSYVTPRMEPYLYFTAAVMLIWACAGLRRLFRPQYRIRSAHCFVLVIPVLLLLLPHTPLNTADLSSGFIGGNSFSSLYGQRSSNTPAVQSSSNDSGDSGDSEDFADSGDYGDFEDSGDSGDPGFNSAAGDDPAENQLPNSTDNTLSTDTAETDATDATAWTRDDTVVSETVGSGTQSDTIDDESDFNLSGLDVKNHKITVSNDEFGVWLSEIYTDMEKYKGYTVVLTGYVYRDPTILKADEFIPARLSMTCCVADLAPAGLICKYDKASSLKADSWVTVEGTLYIGKFKYEDQEQDDPQLTVTKITPAEKVEGYVYPY